MDDYKKGTRGATQNLHFMKPHTTVTTMEVPSIAAFEVEVVKPDSKYERRHVATLALGSQPRQGLAKVRAKSEPGSHISCSRECMKVWGNEPPHSQVSSHFASRSPNGLLNLQRAISRVKTHWIEEFLISLDISWNLDV
jgi:hypothetical protein